MWVLTEQLDSLCKELVQLSLCLQAISEGEVLDNDSLDVIDRIPLELSSYRATKAQQGFYSEGEEFFVSMGKNLVGEIVNAEYGEPFTINGGIFCGDKRAALDYVAHMEKAFTCGMCGIDTYEISRFVKACVYQAVGAC